MKIQDNKNIRGYFERCFENLSIASLNSKFLEFREILDWNKDIYLDIAKRYNKNDDVFYNKSLVLDNPYIKNIKLDDIDSDKVQIKHVKTQKNFAENVSWILPDEKRELGEYIVYKACTETFSLPVLTEGNIAWMSPTLAEQATTDPFAKKAHGNVLTFGLGIGYFVYMCTLNDNVDSITIVEKNKTIIDIFNKFILPQFNTDKKINIIHGDLFNYYNKEFLNKYDYIFVDTWENNDEGLAILSKLFEKNGVYEGDIDYWVEFACYNLLRFLMICYFQSICNHDYQNYLSRWLNLNRDFALYIKKIHKYFRNIDKEISNYSDLQDYIYDLNVMRTILSM